MIINLEQTLADLRAIGTDNWITQALSATLSDISDDVAVRYDEISQTTTYSVSYIGQLKPSGLSRAGKEGDPGYALDTGRLVADLTEPIIAGSAIVIRSDASYAAAQEKLLARKFESGESRYSSFFDDEGYADLAEAAIFSLVEDT